MSIKKIVPELDISYEEYENAQYVFCDKKVGLKLVDIDSISMLVNNRNFDDLHIILVR